MDQDEVTIQTLLEKREFDYLYFTKKVIARFSDNLTRAAQQYLKTDRSIMWWSVDRIVKLPKYVTVKGNVELYPGDLLKTATGEVVLTEDNVHEYVNTFHLIVPMALLDSGSATMLYKHIRDYHLIANALEGDDLVGYLNSLEDAPVSEAELIKDPKHEKILEKITKPLSVDGFDTDGLSDEQVLNIRLFSDTPRGLN